MVQRNEACSIEGCATRVRARGLCKTHYERQRIHGDALTLLRPRRHDAPPTCSADSCERIPDARGLCKMHYRRWQRHGVTDLPQREPHAVFMASVDTTGDCWTWAGYITPQGYGQTVNVAADRLAHRVSYELHVGAIPANMQIDHVCHTTSPDCPGGPACLHRRCVRPEHLELVTLAENVRRGHWRKGTPPHAGEPDARRIAS